MSLPVLKLSQGLAQDTMKFSSDESEHRGLHVIKGSQTARAGDNEAMKHANVSWFVPGSGGQGNQRGVRLSSTRGSQTERACPSGGAPSFQLADMGAGHFKVSVDGGKHMMVTDDASKLYFARQARLDLWYSARQNPFSKQRVLPPWGVSAVLGEWADGSFAFDPARIAGRMIGPEHARLDPYRGVDKII